MLTFRSKSTDEKDVIESMKAIADRYGMWEEVKDDYEYNRKNGIDPMNAAFAALYEWDLCDYEPHTEEETK